MERIQQIKFIFAAMGSMIIGLLGGESHLLSFLVVLIFTDFILGVLQSIKEKNFLSVLVRWGAVNKTIEILIILVLHFCDKAFDVDVFRNGGIVWFCICEGGSIVEHLIFLGLPVPYGLDDVFAKVRVGVSLNFVRVFKEAIQRLFQLKEEDGE